MALFGQQYIIIIDIILFIIFSVDFGISSAKIKGLEKKLKELKELSNKIKEKLFELREAKTAEIQNEEIIQSLKSGLEELKRKRNRLKRNLYRHSVRLKRAFPTIQSDKINEILNSKIDLKTLRNRIHKKKESK